ncbi:hypothetical protein T492DRAFT_846788 [Pavlovales sp. CCMP2436]|nr:hypothetical protein T492DRAFT_846788 [Pavlovales sp. CCMP2436]
MYSALAGCVKLGTIKLGHQLAAWQHAAQVVSWEEWSKQAYEGRMSTEFDHTEYMAKAAKAKEKAALECVTEVELARKEGSAEADRLWLHAEQIAEEAHATMTRRALELEQLRGEQLAAEAQREAVNAFVLRLREENAALADAAEGTLCVVCLEAPKTLLLQPCNHLALCVECKGIISAFPLCREPIVYCSRVFNS